MRTGQWQMGLWEPELVLQRRTKLPLTVERVHVPPLKCQGIKTKLIPFILGAVKWSGHGRWIEPFVGSGALVFNLRPSKALLADANVHVIRLYRDLAQDVITPAMVKRHLQTEGALLAQRGAEYYYEVRERFNSRPSSLDFLFLNRSCFNGVMRFNKSGRFNVPFCQKLDRFRPAYITKIVNQLDYIYPLLKNPEWTIELASWQETLAQVQPEDFVYADPPYFGRHTDYYSSWTEADAKALLRRLQELPAGFALSIWKGNKYRQNPVIEHGVAGAVIRTTTHFYHVGPTEHLRNEIEEALVIRNGFAAGD